MSSALGHKASEEDVIDSMERSLQWRAGDTAAEDYMALCQSGAFDEMAGADLDDEVVHDAEDQKESPTIPPPQNAGLAGAVKTQRAKKPTNSKKSF